MDTRDAFDISSLREKMLAHLGDKSDAYPRQIEQRFPRILAKLVGLWGKPEGTAYLNGLMFSDDRPNREGFPVDVASELLKLSMIHGALQTQTPKSASSQAGWSDGDLGADVDDSFSRRSSR